MSNIGLLADVTTDAKALYITSTSLGYVGTTYMVVITAGQTIAAVIVLQGFSDSSDLKTLTKGTHYILLHENTTYTISGIYARTSEEGTVRTKITMATANSGYRAFVHPLGNRGLKNIKYTASWAIS